MLSSTALSPSVTRPSTGTFSPGRRSSRSPTCTSSTGTVRTSPSEPITCAWVGARRSKAFSASEEPRRLRISIQWPNRTKVTSIAAASKLVSTVGANSVANALKRYATRTPRLTSTFMSRLRLRRARHAPEWKIQPAHQTTGVVSTRSSQLAGTPNGVGRCSRNTLVPSEE